MKYLKKILKLGVLITILSLIAIFGADLLVKKSAQNKVFNSTEQIPHNKVGLLLGTGKWLSSGRVNLYYKYRIEAAANLFQSGKIDYILVSGDNSRKDYDEPSTFKEDLVALGVPAEKIHLDYAGFRTLDSVVRSQHIFGQESITIISQQFHNERALYIAHAKDIAAVGFNASDVNLRYGKKVILREKLARVKMILDLVFGKKPKFLGKKITIE